MNAANEVTRALCINVAVAHKFRARITYRTALAVVPGSAPLPSIDSTAVLWRRWWWWFHIKRGTLRELSLGRSYACAVACKQEHHSIATKDTAASDRDGFLLMNKDASWAECYVRRRWRRHGGW